jgi:carnitine-CoA ligase
MGDWVARPDDAATELSRSMQDELDLAAAECGGVEWLHFLDGGAFTFAQMRDRVEALAAGLAELGVGEGDAVALFSENRLEYVETWFAVQRLGGVIVPVNTSHRGLMLARMLERAEVRFVVAEEGSKANLLGALAELSYDLTAYVAIDGEPPELAGVETPAIDALRRPGAAVPTVDLPGTAPTAIMFTSGTTGASKGVIWTRHSSWWFARCAREAHELTEADVFYSCLPLFHTAALSCGLLASLQARCPIWIRRRFSLSGFWGDIGESRATATCMLGAMAPLLLGSEPQPGEKDHRLRVVNSSPSTPRSAAEMKERFGVHAIQGYGLTDFGVCIWHQPGEATPPGACGKPSDGYECAVVDEDGYEVPTGTPGELWVRVTRPGISTAGYCNDPEATVAALRDQWFHTGDVVVRDAEGFYWFRDRNKDALRRRGENISSFEVEEAMVRHPAVAGCAAYGVGTEQGESEVAVAVVLAPGGHVDPQALIEFAEPSLPYFALPRYVRFMEKLPTTETEKLRKNVLRDEGVVADAWDREAAGYVQTR